MAERVQQTKKVYCAVWLENLAGRAYNDIASSIVKILESVVGDNPAVTDHVLWLDSCVPLTKTV